MYICVCKGINETQLEAAVLQGQHNLSQLQRETGLGTACGNCAEIASKTLQKLRKRCARKHHISHSLPKK